MQLERDALERRRDMLTDAIQAVEGAERDLSIESIGFLAWAHRELSLAETLLCQDKLLHELNAFPGSRQWLKADCRSARRPGKPALTSEAIEPLLLSCRGRRKAAGARKASRRRPRSS